MTRYLGVAPKDDSSGVLQDVHWSAAYFGYFPSYMLGNLYGAQLFAKLEKDMTDLGERIRRGDLAPIREWMREKVHRFGRILGPKELLKEVTGEEPDSSYFLRYVMEKYGEVYRLR